MKVINTFKSKDGNVDFYNLQFATLVYENGDYQIWKRFPKSFIHVHKNYAITELTGASKKLIDVLVSKEFSSYQHKSTLDRAIANREKGSLIAYGLNLRAGKRRKKGAIKSLP